VLTPEGRVSGYLHGVTYGADALRAALARAEAGRVATREEQASFGGVLLSCMGLDPGDPLPLALKLMRLGGAVTAAFLGGFLLLQLRRSRRASTRTTP
jgi:protein SCO1/2